MACRLQLDAFIATNLKCTLGHSTTLNKVLVVSIQNLNWIDEELAKTLLSLLTKHKSRMEAARESN